MLRDGARSSRYFCEIIVINFFFSRKTKFYPLREYVEAFFRYSLEIFAILPRKRNINYILELLE